MDGTIVQEELFPAALANASYVMYSVSAFGPAISKSVIQLCDHNVAVLRGNGPINHQQITILHSGIVHTVSLCAYIVRGCRMPDAIPVQL